MLSLVKYNIENEIITIGFKEVDINKNPFVIYTQIFNNPDLNKQELLKHAYIQIKNTIEYEKTLKKHNFVIYDEGEEVKLEDSKPIKIQVDFNNLKGKVLNQYNDVISTDIMFSIEGTDKVKIENGKIVEESVLTDTGYFIVAKFRDLIEKQQRNIYTPKVVQEKLDVEKVAMAEAIVDLNTQLEILKQEINILKGGK